MNDEQKKVYVGWLNDAHALEESLISTLQKQIDESEDWPEIKDKLEEHLEETKRHEKLVRACLARHDEEPSGGKDFFGKIGAAIGGLGLAMADDTMVKNLHSAYSAEQTEIVTYTLLRNAASELGDMETVGVCDEILIDENEMALWIMDQLPDIVTGYLQKKI